MASFLTRDLQIFNTSSAAYKILRLFVLLRIYEHKKSRETFFQPLVIFNMLVYLSAGSSQHPDLFVEKQISFTTLKVELSVFSSPRVPNLKKFLLDIGS